MARGCSICDLPPNDLTTVNRHLVNKTMTYDAICEVYGISNKSSVSVHKNQHLPTALALGDPAETGLRPDGTRPGSYKRRVKGETPVEGQRFDAEAVYSDVVRLKETIMKAVDAAEEEGDWRNAREAVKAAVPLLSLAARLVGLLEDRIKVEINVVESEEFRFLLGVVLTALANHPEARQDVLKALEAADRGNVPALPEAVVEAYVLEDRQE